MLLGHPPHVGGEDVAVVEHHVDGDAGLAPTGRCPDPVSKTEIEEHGDALVAQEGLGHHDLPVDELGEAILVKGKGEELLGGQPLADHGSQGHGKRVPGP